MELLRRGARSLIEQAVEADLHLLLEQVLTRVGPVTRHVPQARDGGFSTDLFKRYQRSEQAFVLAVMERVVNGVSTRKVSATPPNCAGRASPSPR